MTVTRGFYRHYKGDVYFVTSIGQSHSNADAGTPRARARWVLYESTQSCAPGDGVTRMRPEDEFEEFVKLDAETGEVVETMHGHKPEAYAAMHGFERRFARITDPGKGKAAP